MKRKYERNIIEMELKEINSVNALLAEDINDELFEELKRLTNLSLDNNLITNLSEINSIKDLINIVSDLNNNLKNELENLMDYKYKYEINNEKILKLNYKIEKYEDMIRGFIDG